MSRGPTVGQRHVQRGGAPHPPRRNSKGHGEILRSRGSLRMTAFEAAPRGFSLLEAVIAIVLVGVVLLAAFHVLGGTTQSAHLTSLRATGLLLAQDLVAEILPTDYADPDQTPVFGPEPGEDGGDRTAFDDVDDYDGWEASPPIKRNGGTMSRFNDWTRSVTVDYVDPGDLGSPIGSDAGVKRITVVASFGGKPMAELVALRTDWEPE